MAESIERDLLPGTILGEKYTVVKRLGVGGMGAVYEAVNTWTGRHVALKVLLSGASTRSDLENRFMQEAQSVARLRHPNVIDVLDMGRDRATGSLYMVQELLDGIDLFDYLHGRDPLSVRDAFEIMVPVMGAMIAAHDRGILHRDLKPENIFLQKGKGGERIPKVIDFGVAKVLSGARQARHTGSGQVVGTAQYMSPEQARAEPNLDARCNVWALGVVLYETLSGELPYEAPNAKALIARLASTGPRPISELLPELPASVCALVHKALAVKVTERFQSVREMLDATLALEIFAADPPERSLANRHLRSLPTYHAQLKTARGGGTDPVIPKAPRAPVIKGFSGIENLVDDAVASLGLDAPPGPKTPEARAVAARVSLEEAPTTPAPLRPAPKAPKRQQPQRALKPAPEAPPGPAAAPPAPAKPALRDQSTDIVPMTHPARKPTRWAGVRTTLGPSTHVLMKIAAAAFVLASIFSLALVWRSLSVIRNERTRLNGVIAQVERTARSATPQPPGAAAPTRAQSTSTAGRSAVVPGSRAP